MSAIILKLIACLAMLADHIGFFRPVSFYLVLRMAGRIAFPIFAWNIGNGYSHTRDRRRYLLRLLAAGVLSEIPFDLCFRGKAFDFGRCNVMFTLALGLFAIMLIDRTPRWIKTVKPDVARALGFLLFAVPLAFAANAVGADYGIFGVLLVTALWLAGDRKPWMAAIVMLFALRLVILYLLAAVLHGCGIGLLSGVTRSSVRTTDFAAALAVCPLLCYNGRSAPESLSDRQKTAVKYAFYLFYPAHLMILYLIFR